MRKKLFVLIGLCLVVLMMFGAKMTCFAEEDKTIEEEIGEEVSGQIDDLDMSALENILKSIKDDDFNFFGSSSFRGVVEKIINGEYSNDASSIFSALINLVFEDVLEFLPILTTIVAVGILCGFISALKSGVSGKSVGDIVQFVCFSVIVVLVVKVVASMVSLTTSTLLMVQSQMEAIFPILLTLITALGGTVSVSLFQPTIALLTSGIIAIFTKFVMPIFIFSLVFSIISNLTNAVKLNKFSGFFNSLFKYTIGFVLTIFSAFLSIQGIAANSHDGVSFRTAKFAIKSYVPVLGGYLSDGLDVILTSSMLVKNAVGVSGMILLFATIIVPLVKICAFILCLKLTAAILEPVADSKIANFVGGVSKTMSMLVVMILGVSFMYVISAGVLMATANFV